MFMIYFLWGRESAVKSNLIKKYDYNLVWNDDTPGIFLEQENFDGSGVMQFITQNGRIGLLILFTIKN